MLSIKVLGPGCANCDKVEQIARQAAATLSLEATIEKVADRAMWQHYGLLYTPGLVVNEKLVCGGRVPTLAEVTTWLADSQA